MASQLNGQKLNLKYLFTAYFENGHSIQQTPEDVSAIDPQWRSAFFDVLEYEKNSPITIFRLDFTGYSDPEESFKSIEVDLQTGLFMVGEMQISIADQNFIPTEPLRLIYFRETRMDTNVKKIIGQQDEVIDQQFYINRYFIGWQTTYNGSNYQRTIALKGE